MTLPMTDNMLYDVVVFYADDRKRPMSKSCRTMKQAHLLAQMYAGPYWTEKVDRVEIYAIQENEPFVILSGNSRRHGVK